MSKFHVPSACLYICTGSKCSKRGGKDMYKHLKSYLKKADHDIELIRTECTDRCKFAPVLAAQPLNIWLREYTLKDVAAVVERLRAAKSPQEPPAIDDR